jgi:hypothetical protein
VLRLAGWSDGRVRHKQGVADALEIGHRVSHMVLEGERARKHEPFAQGWLMGALAAAGGCVGDAGRGALLVSDDYAGPVYRISYGDERTHVDIVEEPAKTHERFFAASRMTA